MDEDLKRPSTLLATGEKQIKTPMRFHYIFIKIAKVKNNGNTKCLPGRQGTGLLEHGWGEDEAV